MQSLSFSLCVYAHGGFQVEGKDGIQFESLKRSQSAQTTLLSSLWGWGFFRGDWDLKRTVGDMYRLLETAGVGSLSKSQHSAKEYKEEWRSSFK